MSYYENRHESFDPDSIYLIKLNNDTSIVAQCEDLDPYEDMNIFALPMRIVETFSSNGMKQYMFPWMHGSESNIVALRSLDILTISPASENLVKRYSQTVLSYIVQNSITKYSLTPSEPDFDEYDEESFEQYLQRQNRFLN